MKTMMQANSSRTMVIRFMKGIVPHFTKAGSQIDQLRLILRILSALAMQQAMDTAPMFLVPHKARHFAGFSSFEFSADLKGWLEVPEGLFIVQHGVRIVRKCTKCVLVSIYDNS